MIITGNAMVKEGGSVTLSCSSDESITNVRWTWNGTPLESLNMSNIMSKFSNVGTGHGTLHIISPTVEMNNSSIQCIATVGSVEIPSSNEVILLVEGMVGIEQFCHLSCVG